MNWRNFSAGFAAATVLAAGAGTWAIVRAEDATAKMGFPRRTFFDLGATNPGNGYIRASGALGGPESISSPNNIFQLTCRQERKVCTTESIAQIGSNQIGDIDTTTFAITKWEPDLVEADSGENSPECVTIKLVIHRRDKLVEYVRSPKSGPHRAGLCLAIQRRTIVWQLLEPPYWRGKSEQ